MGHEANLVAGRYRLLGRVGQGAMGVVWRAHDERLGRLVALKRLADQSARGEAAVFTSLERAMREARLTARIRHPHAVTVYDVLEDSGTIYLVLEFLPSQSLTDLLIEDGPLRPAEVARLGAQIASALTAAHAEGVLHRDVTPNNVLVTGDGMAMITDFGIARALSDGTVTGGGLVAGTPAYLAPEVANGGEPDFASDVYSLGATLYTASEGLPPSGTDENAIALLKRVAAGKITPPRHSGPLTDVLLLLLRRDPAERPSMAEAEAMLAAARRPVPAPEPGPPPRRPRRRPMKAAAVAACLITAAVTAWVVFRDDAPVPDGAAALGAPPPTTATSERTVRATVTESAPAVRPEPPAVASCSARYEQTTSWPGGAQAQVTVRNDGHTRTTHWAVTWTLSPGTSIRELWNGTLARQDSAVTVSNAAWNGTLEPGGSVTFGLNAVTTDDAPASPTLTCKA